RAAERGLRIADLTSCSVDCAGSALEAAVQAVPKAAVTRTPRAAPSLLRLAKTQHGTSHALRHEFPRRLRAVASQRPRRACSADGARVRHARSPATSAAAESNGSDRPADAAMWSSWLPPPTRSRPQRLEPVRANGSRLTIAHEPG